MKQLILHEQGTKSTKSERALPLNIYLAKEGHSISSIPHDLKAPNMKDPSRSSNSTSSTKRILKACLGNNQNPAQNWGEAKPSIKLGEKISLQHDREESRPSPGAQFISRRD
ncbi:hypothetical protein Pyn_10062 [Prunus yedoensis var. nudiflora]|uniref:Uncharacterized protein n=1 Tax=Prunus yedoensis var. nudiflora TaxID=2094558 RepID=A0A314Y0T7_PRUYE|nr:hypothetical protein Pyn_10062 [Prunus yedoensis var. nudiflora]